MSGEVTRELLWKLWQLWGSAEHPSEWDGRAFGGGKLSQRFWEYHWTVVQDDLDRESVVLDVGAGTSPFFARLLASSVREVVACDPQTQKAVTGNLTVVSEPLGVGEIPDRPFTHVVSVSVIEHIDPRDRPAFFGALDAIPVPLVLTLEHGLRKHGDNLTMADLYGLGAAFRRHYCARLESCPVWADNSIRDAPAPLWRPLGLVLSPEETHGSA